MSTSSEQLDLKEANVMKVEYTLNEDTKYNFDVTLYHDDDNEDPKYADSWQVETLDGEVLGTRVLVHSHGTVEFTRSAVITIPNDIDELVVRGHDQIHEYGGQVALVKLSTNEVVYIEQGENPMNFTDYSFGDSVTPVKSTEEETRFPIFMMIALPVISVFYIKFRK